MTSEAGGPAISTGELRRQIEAEYPPGHPLTIAARNLPETLPRADYLALLRALLPLARIREDQ
jgi:hypothetical protein